MLDALQRPTAPGSILLGTEQRWPAAADPKARGLSAAVAGISGGPEPPVAWDLLVTVMAVAGLAGPAVTVAVFARLTSAAVAAAHGAMLPVPPFLVAVTVAPCFGLTDHPALCWLQ